MKVSEVKQVLNNPKMQNRNTNFKLLKTNTGGGSKGPRKPPKWFSDFANRQEAFNLQMLEFVKRQEKFNQYVLGLFKKHKWIK